MSPRFAPTRRAVFALAALAATPAFARSSDKKKKEGEGEGEPEPDPTFKMKAMALPVVAKGRLINYVFVDMQLTFAPGVLPTVMAGKEPVLRDAIVRVAHRTPFTRPDSYMLLDEARLKAAVMQQAAILVGPRQIASVTIVKQVAKARVSPPRPAKAAGTIQSADIEP
jgi:hypothetical protein